MDFSTLNESELEHECPYISIVRVQKMDVDILGEELSRSFQGFGTRNSLNKENITLGYQTNIPKHLLKRPRNFWQELKKEFYLLLCTKDPKYKKLRSQLDKKSHATTTTIIAMISAAIAAQLGVAIGIITPLVALLLFAILKLGMNSWCNLHAPIEEKH